MILLAGIVAGALFGAGLVISQMVDPQKVLAFLDIFGDWDPSLALVMGGAVAVAAVAWRVQQHMHRPRLLPGFDLPDPGAGIDGRLITGATLFGLGWGLSGLCPGPALANMGLLRWDLLPFVLAMIAGMLLADKLTRLSIKA